MTVILFVLALSALILVHEWGHYPAARLFGVKAEEFNSGFPPRLSVSSARVEKSGAEKTMPAMEYGLVDQRCPRRLREDQGENRRRPRAG